MPNSLDVPYEQLITAGCDNRLLPGEDGLNQYGCSALPRPAIPLGNCTCSSPSERGMRAARRMLERLRNSDSPVDEAKRVCNEHRRRLRQLMSLPEAVDVALTASGTDVELLVAALAAAGHDRRVVNIVVGPTEVGSGTPLAAAGCHYDNLVPDGSTVTPGAPVSTALAQRLKVRSVDIRDRRGEMRSEFEIDALVTDIVAAEVDAGAHVILHVVAHSKTGMHAPGLACVERIRRNLGDHVTVVVDAAQARVSRRGLREVLSAGYLVMFTGSKFYGGPPFAGALFVPPQWQPQRRGLTALPDGFGHYFTPAELPESWGAIRNALPDWQNYGGILRWTAALAEMDAYYRVDSAARLAVLRAFEETVPKLFRASSAVRMMPVFPPIIDDSQTRLLESKTTVFAFRVTIDGAPLDRYRLKALHRELNSDVCGDYPHLPADVMSREFHLGQPVAFADGSAALRIALGGEMIVRVATDERLGSTLEGRTGWLLTQLQYLRAKLEFLAAERCTPEVVEAEIVGQRL